MMIRIDELLNENDELTSRQTSLKGQYPGLEVSLPTIKRARNYKEAESRLEQSGLVQSRTTVNLFDR